MTPAEAHLLAQDVSLTMEQAFGKSRARLVLGFWAAAMWPKHSRKIFSAKKSICIVGDHAEKVAAYLSSTMPVTVHTYVPGDIYIDRSERNFTVMCGRMHHGVFPVKLESASFDPWPRLRDLSEDFALASNIIHRSIRDFDRIHRATLMASMDLAKTPGLYAQCCLFWAGWGALCAGQAYSETALPVSDAIARAGRRIHPDFRGLVAYKPDWMIILAKSAGKNAMAAGTQRRIQLGEQEHLVCELFRSNKTRWIFDLAQEMGAEYKAIPSLPNTEQEISES